MLSAIRTKNVGAGLLAIAISAYASAQARQPVPPGGANGGGGVVAPAGPVAPKVPLESTTVRARNGSAPRNPSVNLQGRTLRLAPVGRWWDDARYTNSLGIGVQQQKRMDVVFGSNRDQLQKLYDNLRHEEGQLAKVTKAAASEADLDAQIDRVSAARTELQKANTHMLLQMRKELSADQVAKLDAVSENQ